MNAPANSRLVSLAGRLRDVGKPSGAVISVSVDAIAPNPRQPRKTFNPKRMEGLAGSIHRHGVRQPLLLTQIAPGKYELVYGERRWRAAKLAGLNDVPAIIHEKIGRASCRERV